MCGSRQGLRAARYKEGSAGARRHPPPAPRGDHRDRPGPPPAPAAPHREAAAGCEGRQCWPPPLSALRRGGAGEGEVLAPEEDWWSPPRCAEPSQRAARPGTPVAGTCGGGRGGGSARVSRGRDSGGP